MFMCSGSAIVARKIPHRHRKQSISKLQFRQRNPSPPVIGELETTIERQIMLVPKPTIETQQWSKNDDLKPNKFQTACVIQRLEVTVRANFPFPRFQ